MHLRDYYLTCASGGSNDLPQRLTTICIGVPILWMLWSYTGTRQSFFQGTHAIMCWEWMKLTEQQYEFMVVSILLANIRDPSLFLVCLLTVLAVSYILQRPACFWTGLMLITIPCRSWLLVQDSFHHTVSLLLVVWNGDTAALIAGRCWRQFECFCYSGNYLHPNVQDFVEPDWLKRVSPSKSTVGLIGGLLGSTLTYLCLPWFWKWVHDNELAPSSSIDDLSLPLLFSGSSSSSSTSTGESTVSPHHHHPLLDSPVVIGLTLGLAAIVGDLWESAVKRTYNTKDMSRFLPGHGGVLDRFDSSLIAVLLYHYYVEQGIV